MKFSILTLLVLTCLVALTVAAYSWLASPPILRIGMARDAALSNLEFAGAVDLVQQKGQSTYRVFVPSGNTAISARSAIEFEREESIAHSAENYGRFWYVSTIGKFEIEFENNKLKSICCWNGADDEPVDRLVLRPTPK